MMHSRQAKSGQAIIFLMVVMVIGILAVVWSFDLHRVVNAKLRMRNAGDSAALSAARWQGYTLNMIGDLNLIEAALIAATEEDGEFETPPEAYEVHELRARLDYVGPLAAFAIAQQAAFNNGALPNPALAENLLRMAADYRDEIGWNPYPNAREEYADLLENLAVRGVAVSSYGLQLPRHPLVQEQFYGAIAQALAEWWCPMYRYRYQLENYDGYEGWSKLNLEELKYRQIMDLRLDDFWNVDTSGNWLMPSSAVPDEDDYIEELGEYLLELEFTDDYGGGIDGFYGDEAPWHVYNNSWAKRWPRPAFYNDETDERGGRFPIYSGVKPQYNYLGAVAGISMAADVHRGILSSSDNETVGLAYKAKAKVFGFLNAEEGLVPPSYFGFVLPCFQDVRLVHSDIGEKQISGQFYEHITRHLEPYMDGGPAACDPECNYCRLLIEWETLDRKAGMEWLDRAYSDDATNPCRPDLPEDSPVWGEAGGGASGGT